MNEKEPESRTLDYKITLNLEDREDKKEFCADLSSFANTIGGKLIVGIKEEDSLPTEIIGIAIENIDKYIQKLESIIRDSIEPRLSVQITYSEIEERKFVIIFDVKRSWAKPHRVKLDRHFYARHAKGKYPLEVQELRTSFLLSETISQQARLFRQDRLTSLMAGEGPVQFNGNPKTILHVIPFSAFESGFRIDFSQFDINSEKMSPIHSRGHSGKYNFDGYLRYTRGDDSVNTYVQLFHQGIVEAVNTSLADDWYGTPTIASLLFEQEIIEALPQYVKLLNEDCNLSPPYFIMLTLMGIKGFIMAPPSNRFSSSYPIDREHLIIPEVILETTKFDSTSVLKPLFDNIWQASGWPGSPNYDQDGKWKSR